MLEYLTADDKNSILVSDHAVVRYKERSGDQSQNRAVIVRRLKELVKKLPAIDGSNNSSYIRIPRDGIEPIWLVLSGRVIRTVLTHRQYLSNCEKGKT